MNSLKKVMLVDDEVLALRHIRNMIPWKEHGYEIVGEYSNPQKALDNASRLKPDVVIADIKMPIMDGLILGRKLLETNPKLKIILLTSYKEFDYAKEALKLGVFDYWVKHEVNADFLATELARLKREIEAEKGQHELLRRQAWRSLLLGEPLSDEHQARLSSEIEGSGAKVSLMLLGADRALPTYGKQPAAPVMSVEEFPIMSIKELKKILRDAIVDPSIQVLEVVSIEEARWGLMIQTDFIASQYNNWQQIRSLAGTLQHRLKEEAGFTASIVATSRFVSVAQLPELFQKMLRLLDAAVLFFGRGKLLALEEHSSDMQLADLPYRRLEADVKHAVEAGDERLTAQIVHDALEEIKKALDAEAMLTLHERLTEWLEGLRADHGLPSWSEEGVEHQHKPLYTAEEWRDWIVGALQATSRELQVEATYSRKIRQTIGIIRKRYAEDITIDAIAEEVGISGEHLRHLFKEETGQTLHDYLTQVRIERAKHLLLNGQYKIYEVAEMVGYRSGQYFSQVFRKTTGMGPLEYVESKGKQK